MDDSPIVCLMFAWLGFVAVVLWRIEARLREIRDDARKGGR